MRYIVELTNTKRPDNTKILIVEADTEEQACKKAEDSVNPSGNYLLNDTDITYISTSVKIDIPVWEVSVLQADGSKRVVGYAGGNK